MSAGLQTTMFPIVLTSGNVQDLRAPVQGFLSAWRSYVPCTPTLTLSVVDWEQVRSGPNRIDDDE